MKIKKSVLTLVLAFAVVFGMIVGANAADTLKTITASLNYGITIKYNGEVQEMKDANGNRVYPISYEGTTYLPVRAVSNMLGIEVNWDGPTNTVWLCEKPTDSSSQQNTSSGPKITPGSDGTYYPDANGGSNGKSFKASDLIVSETWDDIDGTIYSG